eukprot:366563-Chlamydomonas_euryale.AAC.7
MELRCASPPQPGRPRRLRRRRRARHARYLPAAAFAVPGAVHVPRGAPPSVCLHVTQLQRTRCARRPARAIKQGEGEDYAGHRGVRVNPHFEQGKKGGGIRLGAEE